MRGRGKVKNTSNLQHSIGFTGSIMNAVLDPSDTSPQHTAERNFYDSLNTVTLAAE